MHTEKEFIINYIDNTLLIMRQTKKSIYRQLHLNTIREKYSSEQAANNEDISRQQGRRCERHCERRCRHMTSPQRNSNMPSNRIQAEFQPSDTHTHIQKEAKKARKSPDRQTDRKRKGSREYYTEKEMSDRKRKRNQCRYCTEIVKLKDLSNHIQEKHPGKKFQSYTCWTCGIEFKTEKIMKHHMRSLKHLLEAKKLNVDEESPRKITSPMVEISDTEEQIEVIEIPDEIPEEKKKKKKEPIVIEVQNSVEAQNLLWLLNGENPDVRYTAYIQELDTPIPEKSLNFDRRPNKETVEIPLESTEKQSDPRRELKTGVYSTIDEDLLLNTLKDCITRVKEAIEEKTPTPTELAELTNRQTDAEETVPESESEPVERITPVNEQTAQTATATPTPDRENIIEMDIENDEDMVQIELDDWLTIDSVGETAQLSEVAPDILELMQQDRL